MNDRLASALPPASSSSSIGRSALFATAGTLRLAITAAVLLLPCILRAMAQTTPKSTPNPTATTNAQDDTDTPPPAREPGPASVAENIATARSLLTTAVTDAKHPQHRIQALAAIGTLGTSPRAEKMLTTALRDPDLDVRTAAVLAAGQSKDRNLIAPLRNMLDDKEPQVAFAAAATLWRQNDHSGEAILRAVVHGERKTNAGMVNGTMHTVNQDLHSPTALARIGALQGASLLLGPFGFGITAYEYIHKNGGDSTRVLAVEQIAKELGRYREKEVRTALANVFYDPKLPVRLTAAAAYLRSNGAAPGVPESKHHDERELPFPSTK
jgi:hypothetical protein